MPEVFVAALAGLAGFILRDDLTGGWGYGIYRFCVESEPGIPSREAKDLDATVSIWVR